MTTDTLAIWAEAWSATKSSAIMGDSSVSTGFLWPTDREDLLQFREATRDRLLIMGRNTFNALPAALKTRKALTERPMAIITRNPQPRGGLRFLFEDGLLECDPSDSLSLRGFVTALKLFAGKQEAAIIGGPAVIELFEPAIDRLRVTFIDRSYDGDIYAPHDGFLNHFKPRGPALSLTSGATLIEYVPRQETA